MPLRLPAPQRAAAAETSVESTEITVNTRLTDTEDTPLVDDTTNKYGVADSGWLCSPVCGTAQLMRDLRYNIRTSLDFTCSARSQMGFGCLAHDGVRVILRPASLCWYRRRIPLGIFMASSQCLVHPPSCPSPLCACPTSSPQPHSHFWMRH